MRADAILLPLCAQVLLTLAVWVTMSARRLRSIAASRVRIQALADDSTFDTATAPAKNAGENFENQFEMPVLFYVAAILIFATALTDSFYVALSWIFVAFRVLHAIVHCTTNRIRHRFLTYAISSFAVWIVWIRLSYQVWTQS